MTAKAMVAIRKGRPFVMNGEGLTMGMVDTVICEVELPGLGVPENIYFQTKDLFCYGANLTITGEGRLMEYARYRDRQSGRDMDYHGDIRLCASGHDGKPLEYVARFTHGRLEWLRSASELPEAYLRMLRTNA